MSIATSGQIGTSRDTLEIAGGCHCDNISYRLHWPGDGSQIPVRACSCSFCVMHGGTYTSHRKAGLTATVEQAALLSRYRFGTATADFFICRRCGAVPLVTSEINGHLYAVVNLNTFRGVDRSVLQRAVTDFKSFPTNWSPAQNPPGAPEPDLDPVGHRRGPGRTVKMPGWSMP